MRILTMIIGLALIAPHASLADDEPGYWASYGTDWAVTAASLTNFWVLSRLEPAKTSLIEDHGDEPYATEDTVPESGLGIALGITAVGSFLYGGLTNTIGDDHWNGLRAHDTALGFVETMAITLTLTEMAKLVVARPRPDFDHRTEDFVDGRKSFWSGHSATAFAGATFVALQLGTHVVFDDTRPTWARALAGSVGSLMLAGATGVAISRVTDGRHHISDVVTAGLVGAGVATLVHTRFFGWSGHRLTAYGDGSEQRPLMIGLSGAF